MSEFEYCTKCGFIKQQCECDTDEEEQREYIGRDKMTRIYISGPISGIENCKENFARAEEHLRKQGYGVANPTNVELSFPDGTYEEYMDIDMHLLDMCDAIYMLRGWEKSCGANREYGYALAKDYIILQEE